MRMSRSVYLIAMAIVCGVPAGASADIPVNCGTVVTTLSGYQAPRTSSLWVIAQTSRDLVSCPVVSEVESWVDGTAGGAVKNTGAFVATVQYTRRVYTDGEYLARSKHWLIVNVLDWVWMGAMMLPVDVSYYAEEEAACTADIGYWDGSRCIPNVCPLVLDTDGEGVHLTSPEHGVLFDIDADGVKEQVAWTPADSNVAFLVLDRNGNGRIDDGSELFGTSTPAYGDQPQPTSANGFEALKFAEGPTYGRSFSDQQFDERDALYSGVMLWLDRNHNGISEPDELVRLADAGLKSIDLAYKEYGRRDQFGNRFSLKSDSVWLADGEAVHRPVIDVSVRVIR